MLCVVCCVLRLVRCLLCVSIVCLALRVVRCVFGVVLFVVCRLCVNACLLLFADRGLLLSLIIVGCVLCVLCCVLCMVCGLRFVDCCEIQVS